MTAAARSVPIQRHLVRMMAERFPDFTFGGTRPSLYSFTRRHEKHICDHILFNRDFFQGTGYLSVGWVYCCFNPNWQIYPAFVLGERVPSERLLAGTGGPPANPGYRCYQTPAGLQIDQAMDALERDVRTRVLPWLEGMGRKLQDQSSNSLLIDCAEPYIAQMTQADQEALSAWMHDSRSPCPVLYQQALEAVLALPELKPRQMAEKAEKFLWRWTANRLLIQDYH